MKAGLIALLAALALIAVLAILFLGGPIKPGPDWDPRVPVSCAPPTAIL